MFNLKKKRPSYVESLLKMGGEPINLILYKFQDICIVVSTTRVLEVHKSVLDHDNSPVFFDLIQRRGHCAAKINQELINVVVEARGPVAGPGLASVRSAHAAVC